MGTLISLGPFLVYVAMVMVTALFYSELSKRAEEYRKNAKTCADAILFIILSVSSRFALFSMTFSALALITSLVLPQLTPFFQFFAFSMFIAVFLVPLLVRDILKKVK